MNISSFYNTFVTNLSAADRIFDILDIKGNIKNRDNAKVVEDIRGDVEFKKVYFDVFNTLAYLTLMFLLLSISKVKEVVKITPVSYLLLFIFLWFYLPEIGKSVLWVSGSGNYLWTSVIYLTYFKCIISIANREISNLKGIGIMILGVQ